MPSKVYLISDGFTIAFKKLSWTTLPCTCDLNASERGEYPTEGCTSIYDEQSFTISTCSEKFPVRKLLQSQISTNQVVPEVDKNIFEHNLWGRLFCWLYYCLVHWKNFIIAKNVLNMVK